jgi:hypothetical protein
MLGLFYFRQAFKPVLPRHIKVEEDDGGEFAGSFGEQAHELFSVVYDSKSSGYFQFFQRFFEQKTIVLVVVCEQKINMRHILVHLFQNE